MNRAKFFSLSMDGTTDGGSKEQETLFLRTCIDGEIITRFLCIGEPDSTTANALHAHVMSQIESENFHSSIDSFSRNCLFLTE